jgi:inner membrane protein involved in colicin E2 resistance
VVLAAIMLVTRRIDWYQIAGSSRQPGHVPPGQ